MLKFSHNGKFIAGCALACVLSVLLGCIYAKGSETVLYAFQDKNGAFPQAGLAADSTGNLYGTTLEGGGTGCSGYGCGIVFKVAPDGTETMFYSFCSQTNCTDGASPYASLIMDTVGNLYGTTAAGGLWNGGAVFELAPDGTETVLHSFCSQSSCADGRSPKAGLIMDSSGNLYGTTELGGDPGCPYTEAEQGCGAVFKLSPDGTLTVLRSFKREVNGIFPLAGLLMDSSGNLYGTTLEGGGARSCVVNAMIVGCGTVFELAADGSYTVLYPFQEGIDGAYPVAGLILDNTGNLYGTAQDGGAHFRGTVFSITRDGKQTTLYSFFARAKGSDGFYPLAGLIADGSGNLYGTTKEGGSEKNCEPAHGRCGTVFELAPDGTETVLHSFRGGSDGMYPLGGLIADSAGNLYGTTEYGGGACKMQRGCGVVFKISK